MGVLVEAATFTGEFETHITVSLSDDSGMTRLRQWAADHGFKCLHIVLDRGASASQPMLTRHGRGSLPSELATANAARQALIDDGFPVTRIKIEAAPWNDGVPQTAPDAAAHPPERYFEHHVKILLDPGADTEALARIAQQHTAHLSRNTLKQRDDNRAERFVTQRCYSVGRSEARPRLDALLGAIAPLGYPALEVEEEYVVYDSNLALDAGWIDSKE